MRQRNPSFDWGRTATGEHWEFCFSRSTSLKRLSTLWEIPWGDGCCKRSPNESTRVVPEGETVPRLESDEFALLLTQGNDTGDIIAKIDEALKLPFNPDGHELFIAISTGIREQGGNNYQFYTTGMNAKALHRLTLENNLRRALERKEFEVYYRPPVETQHQGNCWHGS